MLEIGKRLKELRKEKNLSAAELSLQSGVARSLISQIETGKRQSTSIDTVYRLAKALDVPVSYLLSDPSSYPSLYKQSKSDSRMYLKEQDLAYLPLLQKAKAAGLTPELLSELIDIISRLQKK